MRTLTGSQGSFATQLRSLGITLLMFTCGNAGAQEAPRGDGTYLVGARVRYSTEDAPRRWRHATITAQRGDTLHLDDEWHPILLTTHLTRLQVSSGRSHLRGLGVGFLVGGGLGAAAGFGLSLSEGDGGDYTLGPKNLVLGLGAFGAGVGTLLGGAVGILQWLPEMNVTSLRRAPDRERGARIGWSFVF
ncbi:MAG: hypothetical protein JNL26_20675 [Gemmatimonadetes bacterium]|nr:hypothetical protein [Gemmatimonadota bacterium]